MTDLLRHIQTTLAPEYDVHRELGQGEMAAVYGATHRSDGRRVAIKIMLPARVRYARRDDSE